MLRSWFVMQNQSKLLSHALSTLIDTPTQRLIVNSIVDFMIEAYGLHQLTLARRKMTAQAAIILFPFLAYENSKDCGIVSSHNNKIIVFELIDFVLFVSFIQELLVQDGGKFSNRIKTLKRKRKQENAKWGVAAANNNVSDSDDSNGCSDNETTTTPETELQFLKCAVTSTLSRELIVEKLNFTRDLRTKMMASEKTDLRGNFPFFFRNPKTVNIKF